MQSKFINGDVCFTWKFSTSSSSPYVDILYHKNEWIRVIETTYSVRDVLLYDSIYIHAKDSTGKNVDQWEYKILKFETIPGNATKLKWKESCFPQANGLNVYHMYKQDEIIMNVRSNNVSYQQTKQFTKYTYLSNPLISDNVEFEIRNITLNDAGYYNSGSTLADAQSSDGVVLIVYDKPEKPKIQGELNIRVGDVATLKCSSRSTSAPDYYQKIARLSYSWFHNEKQMVEKTTDTIEINVTKDHKFNNYSCIAKEILKSDRSDQVQINPLYGPKEITITSNNRVLKTITVKERDSIGPFRCQADCNPPCNISWTYDNSYKPVKVISPMIEIQANRSISRLQCIVKGETEQIAKNISLDIQYFDKPVFFINDTHLISEVLEVLENTVVRIQCFVDGNPIPSIHLRNGARYLSTNKQNSKWANYTLVSAQCNDTDSYYCTGKSTIFNVSEHTLKIDVMCKYC